MEIRQFCLTSRLTLTLSRAPTPLESIVKIQNRVAAFLSNVPKTDLALQGLPPVAQRRLWIWETSNFLSHPLLNPRSRLAPFARPFLVFSIENEICAVEDLQGVQRAQGWVVAGVVEMFGHGRRVPGREALFGSFPPPTVVRVPRTDPLRGRALSRWFRGGLWGLRGPRGWLCGRVEVVWAVARGRG